MNLADRSSNNLGYVAFQYAAFGRPVKADSILTVLLNNPNSDPVAIAMIYAGKGDIDSTLSWLETAVEMEQKSRTLAQTREWREFRLIQNEPRFFAIMKKMGL
jgi:hypothetical protein